MNARALFAVTVLSLVAPAAAAGQGAGPGVSVQGAFGSNINVGGSSQSLSFGFSPGEHFEFLISAERLHIPSEVTHYLHGYGATRGGTTQFISGEVRFSPFIFKRVSPYALAGVGRGTARPNVNEFFPDAVTHQAGLLFAGGGVRVPVAGHLSAFVDTRFVLQVDSSESGVFLFLPVRAGVAWRF
jgi:hypothetical protein